MIIQYILMQALEMKLSKSVAIFILFCCACSNIAHAQSNKHTAYLNTYTDSLRFAVWANMIDTLSANVKLDGLMVAYEPGSEYYEINGENIVMTYLSKASIDSLVLASFTERLKNAHSDIKKVAIYSNSDYNISDAETLTQNIGTSYSIMYVKLFNPLETWEPVKLPVSIFNYDITEIDTVRKKMVLTSCNDRLTIPVRVIFSDGKRSSSCYYLFNYTVVKKNRKIELVYDGRKKLYCFFSDNK